MKSKQTLGTYQIYIYIYYRRVDPFIIKYADGVHVKVVEVEDYLGSRLTRSVSARAEIKQRVGLLYQRADDLRRLWSGTGISRKRKLELVDILVGFNLATYYIV